LKSVQEDNEDLRIGVFVCHCGSNIAGFVDVAAVAEYARSLQDVVFVDENMYSCADSGLKAIGTGVEKENLNRVVVAACTPVTHEPLFRSTCQAAGLNPYLFEFANIRDQCSWVHQKDQQSGTEKAKDLVRMAVARARVLKPLERIGVDVTKSALVIGGGVSGMTAAIALARMGFGVKLVEKEESLGGTLRLLHKLYPENRSSSEVLSELEEEVRKYSNLEVLTQTKIKSVDGFIGNYKVTVDTSEGTKEFEVGAIVVATGASPLDPAGLFGYDGKRVITQQELESRMNKGDVKASNIVMIQCAGARIPERRYCSRICCTEAVKNARLLKQMNPESTIYILHRGIQTYDTEFEDFYKNARGELVYFIRYPDDLPPAVEEDKVRVKDATMGEDLELDADLVVLSTPLVPRGDSETLARQLRVSQDANGFMLEAHVKLRPVDFATDGIFMAGCCHWPAHIGESVSQALGAASHASIPLAAGRVTVEPVISVVDSDMCTGCGTCTDNCPYGAIRKDETSGKAVVTDVICKGCGICATNCPEGAIVINHYRPDQILAQVRAALEETA
jgi:heterodisulfide reductase subunit A